MNEEQDIIDAANALDQIDAGRVKAEDVEDVEEHDIEEEPENSEDSESGDEESEDKRMVPLRDVVKERNRRRELTRLNQELQERLIRAESLKVEETHNNIESDPEEDYERYYPRPSQAQFDDFDEWDKAKDAWARNRQKYVNYVADQKVQKQRLAEIEQHNQRYILSKVEDARETYKDFDDVTSSLDGIISGDAELLRSILEMDNFKDIAYHLGRNPKEAQRLVQLGSHKKQLMALGVLENRIKLKQKEIKEPTRVERPSSGAYTPVKGFDKLYAKAKSSGNVDDYALLLDKL